MTTEQSVKGIIEQKKDDLARIEVDISELYESARGFDNKANDLLEAKERDYDLDIDEKVTALRIKAQKYRDIASEKSNKHRMTALQELHRVEAESIGIKNYITQLERCVLPNLEDEKEHLRKEYERLIEITEREIETTKWELEQRYMELLKYEGDK